MEKMQKLLGPIETTKVVIYPATDANVLQGLGNFLKRYGYDVTRIRESDYDKDFEKLLDVLDIIYKSALCNYPVHRLAVIMGSNMHLNNTPWRVSETKGEILTGYKFLSWVCSHLDRSVLDFRGILITDFEEYVREEMEELGINEVSLGFNIVSPKEVQRDVMPPTVENLRLIMSGLISTFNDAQEILNGKNSGNVKYIRLDKNWLKR